MFATHGPKIWTTYCNPVRQQTMELLLSGIQGLILLFCWRSGLHAHSQLGYATTRNRAWEIELSFFFFCILIFGIVYLIINIYSCMVDVNSLAWRTGVTFSRFSVKWNHKRGEARENNNSPGAWLFLRGYFAFASVRLKKRKNALKKKLARVLQAKNS